MGKKTIVSIIIALLALALIAGVRGGLQTATRESYSNREAHNNHSGTKQPKNRQKLEVLR